MSTDLIPLFETVWGSIDELCDGLSEDEWNTPTDLPGWSVKDCVSHLIGTESFLAGRAMPAPLDEYPAHVKNSIGKANENFVSTTRGQTGAEVLAQFREITAERLGQLRAMKPEDWDAESWSPRGQGTYRDFMEVRIFDSYSHEQDIRRALGKPGNVSGPVAEAALAEVERALPYIVGKKAGAPQGATVVFEVTGPVERTLAIGVEGRAGYLDEVPPDPDVRLVADFETFHLVTGGRGDGAIAIEGDAELGKRILDNLAFVI
ncbi:MAG: maleylpyruvate isomerase family mycothiol-dependent enzyme [Actinobacteria bacterium ATB1]|nr:maleylpyruvate isomerase family mycothiol-dependent enzyme [Actinobacteria bacterium ATB1]